MATKTAFSRHARNWLWNSRCLRKRFFFDAPIHCLSSQAASPITDDCRNRVRVRVNLDELLRAPQYSLTQAEKETHLLNVMRELVEHHRRTCPAYDRMLTSVGSAPELDSLADVPYLPVGLFKSHLLASVPDAEIFKTLTSSGTTGQQVSRIVLDRVTAQRQAQALAAIMTHLLGPRRLPMIIVDTPN